jgi:tetratricopeptide (TPR) repeat protein
MRENALCIALAVLLLTPAARAQTGTAPAAEEMENGRAAALEAHAEGQKLLARRSTSDLVAALRLFERAAAADATFAPAFAGLAEARALLYDYPGAQEAARQALTLDDRLADAHAVLGFARLHGDWDWAGAEAELKRALELDPGRPTIHLWNAIVLEATGRSAEAVAEARRAVELAPEQANVRAGLGFRLFWARRYDEAVKELEAALKLDPGLTTARYFIGRALVEQHRFGEARAAFSRARDLSPADPNLLSAEGYLDARSGKRDAARRVISQLERLAARDLPFASQIAGLHAALGEKEAALDWLTRARLAHEGALVWLKIDPRFDSLREEPRFAEMLKRMGLPPTR